MRHYHISTLLATEQTHLKCDHKSTTVPKKGSQFQREPEESAKLQINMQAGQPGANILQRPLNYKTCSSATTGSLNRVCVQYVDLFAAAHHDNRTFSHTHSAYERRDDSDLCSSYSLSYLACVCRASCPVGFPQPPIKTLPRNPSLSVTLLRMCVLLPSPDFPSLTRLYDKYSEYCQQSAHTTLTNHAHTHTHTLVGFSSLSVTHVSMCVSI